VLLTADLCHFFARICAAVGTEKRKKRTEDRQTAADRKHHKQVILHDSQSKQLL
jgi:hypothetical protein